VSAFLTISSLKDTPTMAKNPEPFKPITVTSGRICFGALHNIYDGALAPPVNGFPTLQSQASGTVVVHPLQFNIAALSGTWNAYRLVDLRNNEVVAWFVAHDSVDPAAEMGKILWVSGSPYEHDSGSFVNDEKTEAGRILVTNRYDWGYYNTRYRDEIGEGAEEDAPDITANSNSIGIVEPWREPLYDLINEMALSYLEHKVVPRMANLDLSAAAEALFPTNSRSGPESGDGFYHPSFVKPDAKLIPGFDYVEVTGRIKKLLSRFEVQNGSVRFDDDCVAGICRVIARVFAEVLEMANRISRDSGRDKILPCDVRNAVYHDPAFLRFLQFSRVFWEGR